MEWIAIVAASALATVTSAAWLMWWRRWADQRRESWRDALTARRVVVNLKSGQAVAGYLVRHHGPLLFLRSAQLHEPGTDPVDIDGEIIIDRAEVDFIQAP